MPRSSDCRCQRESFYVSGDASRLHIHTACTCTRTQAQFKRGYIKRVSDLDDSLDVGSWEWVTCAGRWGGRGVGGYPSQAGVS